MFKTQVDRKKTKVEDHWWSKVSLSFYHPHLFLSPLWTPFITQIRFSRFFFSWPSSFSSSCCPVFFHAYCIKISSFFYQNLEKILILLLIFQKTNACQIWSLKVKIMPIWMKVSHQPPKLRSSTLWAHISRKYLYLF